MSFKLTDAERKLFHCLLERKSSGCLEFVGLRDRDGYGIFFLRRSGKRIKVRAHRVAFVDSGGCFSAGKNEILHSCDNPSCCDVNHLSSGSSLDNHRDMARRNRGTKAPERPLGIRFHFNRWEAQVKIAGRSVYLGRFTFWQEAAALAAFRRNEALFA